MALTISEIKAARARISSYIIQTPLLRMKNLDQYLGCEAYVKAECMQSTGSFKLRGAMNKILSLSEEELHRGIVAASSGNHGKAIAYACKKLGINATIVLPDSVAKIKEDTIRKWGAEIVKCDVSERFEVAEKLCQERNATLVPPFNDETVMAGQGTAGLEIMEQCPKLNLVIVPTSGGGLIGGVSTAIKAVSPGTVVYGAEPAVLPRYSASRKAGKPILVEKNRTIFHGKSGRFLMVTTELTAFMAQENPVPILDVDLGNYIQLRKNGDLLHFKLTWLKSDFRNDVSGYVLEFDMPAEKLQRALSGRKDHYDVRQTAGKPKAKLSFTIEGSRMLKTLCQDKLERHALRQFFRDNFNYCRNEHLFLYPEN